MKPQINVYPLIRGLASYVIPIQFFKRPGSGGTFSSEYCYSVWLRHLHFLLKNKLFNSVNEIKNIAEIGPGDSLGIGMTALYTGSCNYHAFDVIEHANLENNKKINTDLCQFFKSQTAIPNGPKLVNTAPKLPDYSFPVELLSFNHSYYEQKQIEIDKALEKTPSQVQIKYIVPWLNTKHEKLSEIDLIFSQAVLEHIEDIEFAYKEMYQWLKKGGVISHQVDFKTHELTKEWNGHWFIGPKTWSVLAHGRKYPINRLPLSVHIKLIEKVGFKIVNIIPVTRENSFKGQKLTVPGIEFTEQDLVTSGALIQAVK